MSEAWFYVDPATNTQSGPCNISQLAGLVARGTLGDGTLMWRDGLPGWEPLASIPSLISQVKAPKAAPPLPTAPKPAARPVPTYQAAQNGGGSGWAAAPQATTQGSGLSDRAAAALTSAANWLEKRTADGVPYYFNTATETCDWDKPDCLRTAEELDTNSGAWVWVTDEKEGYAPARVLKGAPGDTTLNVQLQSGAKRSVKAGKGEPLWPLKPSSLTRVEDDLVMVDDINTGLMAHCLRARYRRDAIYTWVGANHSVLVSINPFKQLPIYGPAQIAEYARPSAYRLDPPHTFAIANSAFRRLALEGASQAVLISGESGAGKTEATKQCFSFLAEVAGSADAVEQRILCANPVLEAFGNAKTLRNNNSSRFGRWTEVHFDAQSRICGARIENYLLEKQRVVAQAKGERNYHVFYQLCASATVAPSLALGAPEHFRYLRASGCTAVPGIDDARDFREVEEALDALGLRADEKAWCFETCAAVLHLGNVSFEARGEGSAVDAAGAQALAAAAHFLHVDPGALAAALTERTIEVRGDVTKALNRADQATLAVDALAKAAYDHMFDWLVGRINVAVSGATTNTFIGVLDIFGFEIFEKNHFEQLCINYTNEKLQQHFNRHTFQEEETVYRAEAIAFEHINFIDNQPVVDLIEKKPYGLMPLLDEEVKLPRGGDAAWLGKCKQHNAEHPALAGTPGGNPNRFTVRHYAGDVGYDCGGFVDTNRDNLFRDLYDIMSSSRAPITKAVFPPKDSNPRRTTTLGEKFRRALLDLMALVDACEPWYIRCIKPNDQKAANTFNARMCIEQLTYAGVFEAVAIRKTGYPFRLTHRRFANRYRCLAYKPGVGWAPLGARRDDWRAMCAALLGCVNQDFSRVQIGATMVLYRAEEHRILELLRNLCLERVLPVAQRAARKRIGRSFRRCMRQARAICAAALAAGAASDAAALRAAIARADAAAAPAKACFSWEPPEMVHCKELLFALSEREALVGVLRGLLARDPVQCYGELRAAIARCNKIRHLPGATHEQASLEQQARAVLQHASAVRLDPIADEALALLERRVMEEVVAEAAAAEYDSPALAEVRRKLALPEAEFVALQLEVARATNDPARVVNRQIKLKEMYLDANAGALALGALPALRDAEEWAALKPLKTLALGKKSKADLARGFLSHTTEPIHKSLLRVSGLKGEALKQFKNLLGYAGDRKYQYPDPLLHEIVAKGLEVPTLRSELYVQAMKQLTDNPNPQSEQRCWEVLMLLLHTFPPPEDVENYVHAFVRARAPAGQRDKLKLAVHMSVVEGAKAAAPPEREIPAILGAFFDRAIEPRYNIEQDVVSAAPPPRRAERAGWGAAAASAAAAAAPAPTPSPYQNGAAAAATPYGAAAASPYAPADAAPPLPPPPLPPKPPSAPTARALYDYDPAGQAGMLALRMGQALVIKDREGADWWMAETEGQQGWVPASYVQLT